MIFLAVWAVAAVVSAATAAVVVVKFWPDIARRGFEWLRARNLEGSDLASAWLRLDRTAARVAARLTFRTRQGSIVTAPLAQDYDLNQIEDPRVLEELRLRDSYHCDVLELFVE
ncbi:hypothetical protein [Actinoplanes sp. GCM10030250]|uniref:hypothetical protein n=1 Tax=Actinoplanes sp. GCM10030250 TaxID=3273376 RepID=UPI00360D6476